MTLARILEEEARAVGAETERGSDGLEWRRGERLFAVLVGDACEFSLAPAVADAARRTPDTFGSGRGPGWVRFSPGVLDRMAEDRARAWFASAWRHAAD